MKILIVNPRFFVFGGAERQIVQLANYLSDMNHNVTILTEGVLPEMRRDLTETRLICTNNLQNLQSTYHAIMHKFDILNPHNHPVELLHYPRHAKVVWQANEPPIEQIKGAPIDPIQKKIVQDYIDTVCVIDDFNAERFEKIYDKKPVIDYPGIRYETFAEERPVNVRLQERFGLKDKFVLLHAGYITWTKNQIDSVRILAQLKKDIPNVKLVLAGWDKDPYSNDVRSVAHELGVAEDVVITGYLQKDDDMFDLYYMTDIYVSPILEQGGYANPLEAVSAGIPTIISETTTCKKIFADHELGVIAPIKDFAANIVNMRNNIESYRDKTKKNRGWVRDNLSWKNYSDRYEKIFMDVLSND